jgi:NTE family protein
MEERGRTALVLSAGGMFGAYQAGVWLELSRVFDPDIVVGASAGSLNGWLVASRAEPEELAAQWMQLGHRAAVRWKVPRSLNDGVVDNSALEEWVRNTCSTCNLSRRFGVVVTRMPNLRPVLFESPNVDWRHVVDSCAVPVFLPNYSIDGETYSDGGIIDPLPLWAALQMGATTIVTVNVLKHRPWFMRTIVGTLQALTAYRQRDCSGVRIVDISPSGRLGSFRDSMYWDAGRIGKWIEQGRRDALRSEPRVVECQSWLSTASTE